MDSKRISSARVWRGGIGVVLGLALATSVAVLSADASVTHPRGAADIKPWLGSWHGDITAAPAPACTTGKPKCPNPFAATFTITSANGGTVSYPTLGCKGQLHIQSGVAEKLTLILDFTTVGKFPCVNVVGTLTALGPGLASWDAKSTTAPPETYTGVLSTAPVAAVCAGAGQCAVTAASPQVVCLTAPTCPPGGTLVSTITVGAFANGTLAPNKPVTVKFLSGSGSTTSGSWCQGANGTTKSGHTDAHGFFAFSYTTAGAHIPTIPSFCVFRVTIAGSSVMAAIDQTNDPAPWSVHGTPSTARPYNVPSSKVHLKLAVTNPNTTPHWVIGDPTTFYSEVPSTPGACGAFTPLVRKTVGPRGRATLVYTPSTVGGRIPTVSCALIGQEADTGATSNKVTIYQRRH